MSDSFAAEEKQRAGLRTFIGLVDAALQEAHRMLETVEGDEQVYFAVELATHFLTAANAVMADEVEDVLNIEGRGHVAGGCLQLAEIGDVTSS